MLHIVALAQLGLVAASSEARQLSWDRIASYEPASGVDKHKQIDLDQKEIEEALAQSPANFAKAEALYVTGGHSGPYARLTVPTLPAAITKGQIVKQTGNTVASGYIMSDRGTGVTSVDIGYNSKCIDNTFASKHDTTGCFTKTSALMVGGAVNIGVPSVLHNKYRTLSGFSTDAAAKMVGEVTFEKYKKYYTYPDYADRYVKAALKGTGAFQGKDEKARIQGVKKGSAYMNVWMYTIHQMEQAIKDCTSEVHKGKQDPVYAWDKVVAYYVGGLEGLWGAGSGKLLYNLADMRCQNFKTCGAGGTAITGNSQVNEDIMTRIKHGKSKILSGKCSEASPYKDQIISLMTVPLIQGALRYAYKVDKLSGGSKEKAEGAVFSAAVLPMIDACSKATAKTISDNMKIDTATPMKDGFDAVKLAFESVYSCLGISCAQVGGLIQTGNDYYEGAEPCGAQSTISSDARGSNMLLVLAVISSVIMFATQ
jgi:hypothetical protein